MKEEIRNLTARIKKIENEENVSKVKIKKSDFSIFYNCVNHSFTSPRISRIK